MDKDKMPRQVYVSGTRTEPFKEEINNYLKKGYLVVPDTLKHQVLASGYFLLSVLLELPKKDKDKQELPPVLAMPKRDDKGRFLKSDKGFIIRE